MEPCARGNKIIRMDKLTSRVTADDCATVLPLKISVAASYSRSA
jgi:hypothetical protein